MQKLAPWAVRLVGLWILAGGLAKLFLGTPVDLPTPVRELAFGMEWNFRVAIAVEIAIGLGAQLMPRRFWLPVAAIMLVFLGVLGVVLSAGEESCGCFGSDFPIPPWGMMTIDGVLLLVMLATQPWKIEARSKKAISFVWLIGAVAGAIAPFAVFGMPISEGEPTPDLAASTEQTPTAQAEAPEPVEVGPWELPPKSEWPRWVQTGKLSNWVGHPLSRTPVGVWVDTTPFPDDIEVILWRRSCDHCATELAKLARQTDLGPLALVRIDDDEGMPVAVKQRPTVPKERNLVTPNGLVWPVSTPVVIKIEGGKIVSAEEHQE